MEFNKSDFLQKIKKIGKFGLLRPNFPIRKFASNREIR